LISVVPALALMLACAGVDAASAVPAKTFGTPVPRVVLALYDGTAEAAPRTSRLHRFVELPLNVLGYQLAYHDLGAGLPPSTLGAEIAGVVSWFDRPVPDPQAFALWASSVRRPEGAAGDVALIVLGETGLTGDVAAEPQGEAFLQRLGIRLREREYDFGIWGRAAISDPTLIGFERDFTLADGHLPLISAVEGAAQVHLSVGEPAAVGGVATDLVVSTAAGAYAHSAALVRYDAAGNMAFWLLDPFTWFERCLGDDPWPRPDTTTLSGRRLFFSNLNGEGWTLPVGRRGRGSTDTTAAERLVEDVLKPFPDIPVTVALVTGDLSPALNGRAAALGAELARVAFALPQVEIGSRSRTLPLQWGFFETYRPEAEREALRRAAARARDGVALVPGMLSGLVRTFSDTRSTAALGLAGAPRQYAVEPFDLAAEIEGSFRTLEDLAPPGRTAAVMAWSGDAKPFEAALAQVRGLGAANLGGGGGLFDPAAPSIANLAPFSVAVGPERQIYDALAGDALLTKSWTTPLHGLLRLEAVYAATDLPRRLKPMQLAYTAFSALEEASFHALKHRLEAVRTASVAPVRASDYARMVEGFTTVRITDLGGLRWRIESRGALETVRFDGVACDAEVDWQASQGVLGSRCHGDALYVALDAAVDQPVVALAHHEDGAGDASGWPFRLEESRWRVRRLERDACTARFEAGGFGPGEMTWLAPARGPYRVGLAAGDGVSLTVADAIEPDADGRLRFTLPATDGRWVEVTVSGCG